MGCVRPYVELRKRCSPSELFVQPLQVVIAPLIQASALLYLHHILVCTRKHDADSSHLVGGNFPLDTCRLDALGYGMVTAYNFTRFPYQLPVQVSTGRVGIGWYRLALDVVGHTSVGCTFYFGKL